ncbi:MAG TPA: aminotransferase class IV [Sedimentisphaerales bacterium]|nr:aminotransferase class IV [Sedimentisphaerales bacterium]
MPGPLSQLKSRSKGRYNLMQIAMIQDKIVPFERLEPVYLDRGTFFGDGVYEVVRSYKGRIFALEDHLARFANSLSAIEIKGVDIDLIRARVKKAFDAAGIADARIYFHVTRGSDQRNHTWPDNLKPNFFLTVTQITDRPETKTKGIAVSTHPDWRWKRCDIKSLNLLPNVLAKQKAAREGCQEAIFVNEAGLITEGSHSAFFTIFGRKLQTAELSTSILPSITRKFVLQAAKDIRLEIVEKSLTPREAAGADELFIAVTTEDIVPVVRFEEKVIGDGTPGSSTKKLIEKFRSFTR